MGLQKQISRFIGKLSLLSSDKSSIAKGFATGVAISFTPFVGAHTLLALALAQFTRQNKTAALLGTLLGNPWTFPLIWYLDWQAGLLFMPKMQVLLLNDFSVIFKEAFHALITLDFRIFFYDIWPMYQVMLIGCLPCSMVVWLFISRIGTKLLVNAAKDKQK